MNYLQQDTSLLLVNNWRKTSSFQAIYNKKSQYDYYKENSSSKDIIQLVRLESKSFGSCCENIIKEIFKLEARKSTQNDACKNGKKIEIKCARYWKQTNDCKWQHIELDYDYHCILLVLLDFTGFKVWFLDKKTLLYLVSLGLVTRQGQQGFWCQKSKIEPYLQAIHSLSDLENLL
jgi:hypothetical protein